MIKKAKTIEMDDKRIEYFHTRFTPFHSQFQIPMNNFDYTLLYQGKNTTENLHQSQ